MLEKFGVLVGQSQRRSGALETHPCQACSSESGKSTIGGGDIAVWDMSYCGTLVALYGRLHQGSYDLALLDVRQLSSRPVMRAGATPVRLICWKPDKLFADAQTLCI